RLYNGLFKLSIMSDEILLNQTIHKLRKLPASKIEEVDNYVDSLLNKLEEKILSEGIQKIVSESETFKFLEDEEELYSMADLKYYNEIYYCSKNLKQLD
ncbi:MAG: hypothetical protein NWP83_03185, partial [Spirosomaceae bacterium]|nr:hypothetical protein [Spirosomataceae bacterium]